MTNVADRIGEQDEEQAPAAPPAFEPLEGERLEHMVTDRRGPLRWAASLMLSFQARQAPTPTPGEAPTEAVVAKPVVAEPVIAKSAPEPAPAPPPPPAVEKRFAKDAVDVEEPEPAPVVIAEAAPVVSTEPEPEPVVVTAPAPAGGPDLSGALAVRARLRGETPVARPVEDLEEEPARVAERSTPEIVKFPSARQLRRLDRKAERAAAKEEKRLAEAERAEIAAPAKPAPVAAPTKPAPAAVATPAKAAPAALPVKPARAKPAPVKPTRAAVAPVAAPAKPEPAAPMPAPERGLTRAGRAPRRRSDRPEVRRPDAKRPEPRQPETRQPAATEPEPPALTNVPVWSATGDDEGAWNRWHTDPSSTDADDRWATLDEDLHRELPKALRLVERWGGRRHREDRSMFDED